MPARKKLLLAGLGVSTLTAGAMYFGFANFSAIESTDVGFRVLDSRQVELDFEVIKPAESTALCKVEALNEQFAQVGYKELTIGPQESSKVRLTVSINTTEMATTALVDECTLK